MLQATSTNAGASSGSINGIGLTRYPIQNRKPEPPLVGSGLDGKPISLATLGAGKVVFVNVWASWCSPCRAESPMLATSARSLEAQGVQFLGLDEDYNASAGRAFATSNGSPYPSFADKDGALLRKVHVLPQSAIPSTLVIDRHGRIAAGIVGVVTASEIRQLVDALTAES
jgi:thiol-disulfide isomerase/thioredoxin